MGWKNVKEHYKIVHIVQVNDKGICIGSSYIHDLMVISPKGELLKRPSRVNADLSRYETEMDADPEELAQLVVKPDVFEQFITVYTYDEGKIIAKQCEAPGWPHVTHDGSMMYDNTYSTDKMQVVEWAKQDARAGIKLTQRSLAQRRQEICDSEARLLGFERSLSTLEAEYPRP